MREFRLLMDTWWKVVETVESLPRSDLIVSCSNCPADGTPASVKAPSVNVTFLKGIIQQKLKFHKFSTHNMLTCCEFFLNTSFWGCVVSYTVFQSFWMKKLKKKNSICLVNWVFIIVKYSFFLLKNTLGKDQDKGLTALFTPLSFLSHQLCFKCWSHCVVHVNWLSGDKRIQLG